MKNYRLSKRKWLALLLIGATASTVHAQSSAELGDYPKKAIRIVVPFGPGGFNDALARTVAAKLSTSLKQTVIVDNRPGGGTVIGNNYVAKAAPDGYTLLQLPGAHAINAALPNKLPYDSLNSFSFISLVATSPFLLVTNNDFPAKSLPQLVSLAKQKPGAYSYSSSGNGGNAHLMGEMLKSMAGIDILHVPYKGAGPAMNDVIGGQVNFTFATYAGASASIKAGRLRMLAVTSKKRWSKFPDVPTIAEAGYPNYDAEGWWGYAAPAGTPAPIIAKLNEEIRKAIASEEIQRYLESEGVEAVESTPAEFRSYLEREIQTWTKVITEAKIQLN